MKQRQIKFRAWTNNCWINKGMVYDYQDTVYPQSFSFNDADVPLMQFTGLNDKNGKEIYEGDIIQRKELSCNEFFTAKYEVVFVAPCYCLKTIESEIFKKDAIVYTMEEIEIIGNIYEK